VRKTPSAQQPDRFVAREQIEQVAQRRAARGAEFRIAVEDERCVLARRAEQFAVDFETGEAKTGHAALPCAKHVAFAAQP
jgi:hypothetical protein